MKYKSFQEWFVGEKYHKIISITTEMENLMLEAWDACVNNMPDENAAIGELIMELLNGINIAEKIDCTCDKGKLSVRYPCCCQRSRALQSASIELGKYLQELRKELE